LKANVFLLDLAQPSVRQLTDHQLTEMMCSVGDHDVAWLRGGEFADNLFVMDLQTGFTSQLTSSGNLHDQYAPDTDGGRVVWDEARRTYSQYWDYDIYMAERDAFPAAPQDLEAVNGGSETINLDWADNTDADLAGYTIYRRLSTRDPYTRVGTTTQSEFTDTDLIDGTRYYYRVCAIDESDGESSFSNESSAVPRRLSGGSPIFRKSNPHQQP
jgi:hypothetical protein